MFIIAGMFPQRSRSQGRLQGAASAGTPLEGDKSKENSLPRNLSHTSLQNCFGTRPVVSYLCLL
jgi:hypothetical protein